MEVDNDGMAAELFAVPDFWRPSTWLTDPGPNESHETYFFTLDVEGLESRSTFCPISIESEGFFKPPSLEPIPDEPSVSDAPTTEDDDTEGIDDFLDDSSVGDIWIALDTPRLVEPRYRTWGLFDHPERAQPQVLFISEAGPAAYDTIIGLESDPLRLRSQTNAVIDTKTYISAILALCAGRESLLFRWDQATSSFKSAVPAIRISGYSASVLEGVEGLALRCGSTLRRLRDFVQETYGYGTRSIRSQVALASAVDSVLGVVQGCVAMNSRTIRSLLQIQVILSRVSAILNLFDQLAQSVQTRHSDEEILTVVFRQAQDSEYAEPYLRDVMREVLQRVSAPWIDFLGEWLGTKPEGGIPLSLDNIGARNWFVKVETEIHLDDFGQEVEEVDFRLDQDHVPDFLPMDVAQAAFEMGKNLRFIRSNNPGHPLARDQIIPPADPPQPTWLFNWDRILKLEQDVSEYRARLATSLSHAQELNSEPTPQTNGEPGDFFSCRFQIYGTDQANMEQNILASIRRLDQPLVETRNDDSLQQIVRNHLVDEAEGKTDSLVELSPPWSLLPSLSFGPLVAAQGRLINRESLRLLFNAHGLRDHLCLQKDFHLFGNGTFASKLSHALFDPDMETAERRAGVALQGGAMGLRLSGRDTWPPASSELRLALKGILVESYWVHEPDAGQNELPGDLSFAVRDMRAEDVDKCMDQDNLEALDFLRLSYKSPSALASIFTPDILIQYDRIFKLLLRVLRLLYVTNQLFRQISIMAGNWAATRFVFETHHFVSSMARYFMDTGIAMPWQAFERWLDKVQADVNADSTTCSLDTAHSPERLRRGHVLILNHIMAALLLRKRQRPVLKLLDEMFATVLQFAKRWRDWAHKNDESTGEDTGPEVGDLYQRFRKRVEVFITVCRGLLEKGGSGHKTAAEQDILDEFREFLGESLEDHSSMGQLLTTLDMFNYYDKRI